MLFFDGDGVDVVDVDVVDVVVGCILVIWTAIDVFFSWVVEVVNFSIHLRVKQGVQIVLPSLSFSFA